MAEENKPADLQAMIHSVRRSFPKVDPEFIESLIDWVKVEMVVDRIPEKDNELYTFSQYIVEVLGQDLNGHTKTYIEGIMLNYRLGKIAYGLQAVAAAS